MDKETVPHFGLHRDSKLGALWLLQSGGGQATFGLPATSCPFQIRHRMLMCPHNFDLRNKTIHLPTFQKFKKGLENSELLKLTSPVPYKTNNQFFFIETDNTADAHKFCVLQNLLSPMRSLCRPISTLTGSANAENMTSAIRCIDNSNLGRLYVTGVKPDSKVQIQKMVEASINSQGRTFFIGQRVPFLNLNSVMQHIVLDKELLNFLDWFSTSPSERFREYGTELLREYMKNDDTNL